MDKYMKKLIFLLLFLILSFLNVTRIQAAQNNMSDKQLMKISMDNPSYEITIAISEKLNLSEYLYDIYSFSISEEYENLNPKIISANSIIDKDGCSSVIIRGKKGGVAYINTGRFIYDDKYATSRPIIIKIYVDSKKVWFYDNMQNLISACVDTYKGEPYIQLVDGGQAKSAKLLGVKGKVKYKSSNKKIFKVSKKGKITPISTGNALLIATDGGKKYVCHVCVISRGLEYGMEDEIRVELDGVIYYGVPVSGIGTCKDKK